MKKMKTKLTLEEFKERIKKHSEAMQRHQVIDPLPPPKRKYTRRKPEPEPVDNFGDTGENNLIMAFEDDF